MDERRQLLKTTSLASVRRRIIPTQHERIPVSQDDGRVPGEYVDKSIMAVPEGWGLTWADDQIWSGMYGISLLKSARWRFASSGKGRWMHSQDAALTRTLCCSRSGIVSTATHQLTTDPVGHYSTVSLSGAIQLSTPQPIYDDIHTTLSNITPISLHGDCFGWC